MLNVNLVFNYIDFGLLDSVYFCKMMIVLRSGFESVVKY